MAQFEEENIMSTEQFEALFVSDGSGSTETTETQTQTSENEGNKKENSEQQTTEESAIDLDNPFMVPESVGSEEKKPEEKENTSAKGNSSPIYSSLAKALAEEGILFNSENNKIEDIKDSESLLEAMKNAVQSQLDEEQKRISQALDNGVEPNVIQNYEATIKSLNSITESQITEESEQAENLRKNIIFRDFINRGFTQERAQREVEKSLANGTEIQDAKDALVSIKEVVKAQYQTVLKEAEDTEKQEQEKRKKQATELRKGVLEGKELFGELELDKLTRQKVLDNIIKPVWTNPETGEKLTAIQKYEAENRVEFLKKVGIIYTLTDGFQNLDGLVKGKVRKEVNKSLKELESTINNTQVGGNGALKFTGGVTDSESYLKTFTLDV